MSTAPLFIELDVFGDALGLVNSSQGGADYQDVRGLYRDLSMIVVGWLAKASRYEVAKAYEIGGWRGTPNVHALQQAARMWYAAK